MHASQPGKRFIHKPGRDSAKELLQTLDSVDTGQAGPSPSAPQGVPRRALGHYSMEIVANLAVWLGGECQVGQMIDWFGSYDRTSGLSARLLLRKPANEGSERDFRSPPSAASSACRHPSIRWKAATTEPFPRLSISFSYLAAVLPRPGYARLKPVENPRDRRVDKPAEALCITPHVDNEPFHPQLKTLINRAQIGFGTALSFATGYVFTGLDVLINRKPLLSNKHKF